MKRRTELHIHSNMSVMDGLTDIKMLLEKADRENMYAVAITDHGVCHGFPELFRLISGGKYNVRAIFGMEGYLLDDDSEESLRKEFESHKPYHIIIQVKNATGLKNLYKIASMSHMFYVMDQPILFNVPLIPKSFLKANREGLIIGSACEAGEFYRAVRKEKPLDALLSIAEFYDYLEIQPLSNNKFLVNQSMVKDMDALKALNEKVCDIGKRLNKPVCATSDAHYLEPCDSIARKAVLLAKGVPKVEGEPGVYMRDTEEMYEEFLYLGEEKANDVVFENPNKIAREIDDIKIAPPDFRKITNREFIPGGFIVPMGELVYLGREKATESLDNYLKRAPYDIKESVTEEKRERFIELMARAKVGMIKSDAGQLTVPKGQEAESLGPVQYAENDLKAGSLITHFDRKMWEALL